VGDHIVTLTVMDGAGHVSAAACTVEVLADAAPVASAGPDQEVDEDTLVTFDGAGSSDDLGVLNWTWTITPTSAVMYGESPEYTFSEPGVYTVELVVTDTVGQESEIDTMTVTVLDVTDPTADAGADQEVSFGEEVTFDGSDSSDNVDIASYEWTFDDVGPETLTGATPAYTFTAPGDYTVTLTVADSAGNEDSDTMVVTVVDDEAPVADAGPDPTDVVIGDLVSFDAAASADNVGIANYTWNFTDGDEVFLYGDTVSYLFENAGEFVVTLTVTDAAGLSDTDTVVVRVSEELNEAPDADAGDDIEASEGDAVTFDGSGSSDDVEVESYTWTFEYDDEVQTLTGVSPEFVFEVPGTYVVTLNVTDAEGEWDTDTVVVIVEEKASTFFTEYWWVLAAVAAIVVIAVLALLMRGGKASAASTKPEDEGDELEEEELPPPDDEDV
jgi:PKD repeat protein